MTKEKQFISDINNLIRKSPAKQNLPYQSDSEIVSINHHPVALSSDILIEEIEQGVFKNLYAIGWYSAIMTISDIMATGCKPNGLMMNLSLPQEMSEDQFALLISGIEDCCKKHDTYILGGDTNFGKELNISSFGIGTPISQQVVGRKPLQPGDLIYLTDNVGTGNLTAFYNLNNLTDCSIIEHELLPSMPPDLAAAIGRFANTCIDTSDGLMQGLFELLDQNQGVGIQIDADKIPYHPLISKTSQMSNLPPIVFTGGEVGDYGLLFAVRPSLQNDFKTYCREQKLFLTEIGIVTNGPGLFLNQKEVKQYVEAIASLRKTPEDYIRVLIQALC